MTIFNKKENEPTDEPQKISETLGARLAAARKRKGYTQEDFSDLLGVTPQAVSKWENDLSCPDILTLPKISELLEISIDELLTGKKTDDKTDDKSENEAKAIAAPVRIDTSKMKLRIRVLHPNKKPVDIALPFALAKKVAKIGNGISGIVGTSAIDSDKLDSILNLVEEGAVGELLNITAEDDTNIIIEIS